MKAIQITEPSVMKVVDIEKPQCGSDEVLLRIHYVGFCGSDLNTYRGLNPMVKMPVIPGHEIGAEIAEVGANVPSHLKPGMAVTVNPYTNCGHCPSCKNRRYNACQHNETLGVQRNGAMREYIAIPWQKVIPIGNITVEHAALIEPMSVGFHAVSRAHCHGYWLWYGRRGCRSACYHARCEGHSLRYGRRETGHCSWFGC